MKLIINGERHDASAETLASLLNELNYHGGWLATARNGDMIPAAERAKCRLMEGDHIEILSPMKGG